MPGFRPSGVGNATTSTVVYTSVSVSGSSNSPVPPSSTHFLSSPLSPSFSKSVTAVNTFNKLLTVSQSAQTTASSASGSLASSVGHVDSSPIFSSVTFTASTTPIFTTVIKGLDVSHAVVPPDASSPVAYTEAVSSTLPSTTTSSSTTPATYNPMSLGSTRSTLTTQSGDMSLASVPAALDANSTRAASLANHEHHTTGASTSDSAPELTSTRVLTSNRTSVSSVISGATTSTESAGPPAHTPTKPPKAPQQIISTLTPVNTQIVQSGFNLLTTLTSGSLVSIPTTGSDVYPNGSSTSNSLLFFILGLMLGVLVIVALGITVFRCRARRRSENMSIVLSSDSETLQGRNDWVMVEETPRVNAFTLGQRITSYRGSSIHAPEHIITRLSHAGESSQNSNGQFSDPFADGSGIVSSRTNMLPASIHSVDSVSTNLAFTMSVNADAREVGESGGSIDANTSSLELNFVAPLPTDDSSTRSPYLSPSWHYDGQSPTSSPREREHWNEEQQGETSHVSLQASPPATPKPFLLGTESPRLRLHALLSEARRISYEQENRRSARTLTLQSRDK